MDPLKITRDDSGERDGVWAGDVFVSDAEVAHTHPLATKQGLELFLTALFYTGAMCQKCGYGTRCTSKRWAKCKKCGERVARRALPEIPRVVNSQEPKP